MSGSLTALEGAYGWNLSSETDPRSTSPSPSSRPEDRGEQAKSYCILLVEDNPADVLLVRESLAENGVSCDLTVMHDGEAAIDFVDAMDRGDTPCPELIVLDLNLPKRSGMDVLKRIRASSRCSKVPVVILSSSDMASDRQKTAELGSSRYLTKPNLIEDFIQLGAVLKQYLEGGEPQS